MTCSIPVYPTLMRTAPLVVFATMSTLLSLATLAADQKYAVTGAEVAGNGDGSIPAWQGHLTGPLPGWSPGMDRESFSPFKDERPIRQIDLANSKNVERFLTPGQIALLAKKPGYGMPIYAAHRSCGYPGFVTANTKRFQGQATIAANGWSIEKATLPSVPFPQPRAGIEVIWNFLLAYQGVGIQWTDGRTYLSPHSRGTAPVEYAYTQRFYFPWAVPGAMPISEAPFKLGDSYTYRAPPSLAGQAISQRYYFDRPAETLYYFPGQNRVRRLNSYTHDAPSIGGEKTYPMDAAGIFNGDPDRFDWTLLGKREIYVPYNVFNLTEKDRSGRSIFEDDYISASARRYELHRVWVIDGRLKPGMRHSTPHKVLYFDEDSWLAVIGEDYDSDEKLVRYKESAVMPVWEIGACSAITGLIIYDLVQNRYVRDAYVAKGADVQFFAMPTQAWMRETAFNAESLRPEDR